MGNGGCAKGRLAYQKTAGDQLGATVSVSGTLKNAGFEQPGTPLTVQQAKLVVRGRQTYDLAKHEWDSGKLSMDVSFRMTVAEEIIGTAAGIMIVNFKKLPRDK